MKQLKVILSNICTDELERIWRKLVFANHGTILATA
jgi:hypothetical protein